MNSLPAWLAANTRRLRDRMGWSQADLAARANVARATVNRVESGSRSPPLATVERLASALGVTAERLLRAPRRRRPRAA